MNGNNGKLENGRLFHRLRSRDEDRFLEQLDVGMRSKTNIIETLDTVLKDLRGREYVCPRIYRYRPTEEECLLLRGFDLPEKFAESMTSFPVKEDPLLEEIINGRRSVLVPDVSQDGFYGLKDSDPMKWVLESFPEATAMIGLSYSGNSQIYPKEIKGAIIMNFSPKKLRDLNRYFLRKERFSAREEGLLKEVSRMVGDQVSRLLELDTYQKLNAELEEANKRLGLVNEQLGEQIKKDGFTGLYSHHTWYLDRKKYFLESRMLEKSYHACFMDFDYFKRFNDAYGHAEGDKVLLDFSRILLAVPETIAYRVGGEEFLLLLKTDSRETVLVAVEEIRKKVCQIPVPEGCTPRTLSIGIAQSADFNSSEEWHDAADLAMYRAKEAGRNQIVYSVPAA